MAAAHRRVSVLTSHLQTVSEDSPLLRPADVAAEADKAATDVVIVSAVRTPIARARKGTFKDTYPDDLLATVLKGVTERVNLDKKLVDDIQVGNVLLPGAGAREARQAMFYAGFPETTTVASLNRQCSSGLEACARVASAISAGYIDIGIGAGVESMTKGYGASAMGEVNPRSEDVEAAADCNLPMGATSENVAKKFGITRDVQDKFAFASYQKALAAQKAGKFNSEIVPVTTTVADKEGNEKEVTLTTDEGPRPTTLEQLNKLRPAFGEGGCSTAGNSSQVSDGAAAVLLMRRSRAQELGLKVLARVVGYAVAGVPPAIMGIGPVPAIRKVTQQTGIPIQDVDVFEINEAFASQAVYSVQELGIKPEKVNPNGGAIALGHPLGCTGARQIATILPELKRTKGKYGVVSMCIGTGMGAAMLLESEQ